jgi:hypothetical protein
LCAIYINHLSRGFGTLWFILFINHLTKTLLGGVSDLGNKFLFQSWLDVPMWTIIGVSSDLHLDQASGHPGNFGKVAINGVSTF